MIINENDELIFSEEENSISGLEKLNVGCWNVLIVDDEKDVHTVTKMALDGFVFMNRKICFHSCYSAKEAYAFLREKQDIALILMDVVMEENDSGLQIISHIRKELKNKLSRIILRTGQPGQAPEKNVVIDYDISDYKTKTELTSQKLFTTVVATLRDYENLCQLAYNVENLESIVNQRTTEIQEANEEIQTQNEELIQANEELYVEKIKVEESQKLFKCFYDSGLVGLANTSIEKRWLNANDFLCEMLEYSWYELQMTTWTELTYPDDIEKDTLMFDRVIKGEIEGYELEKRFITKTKRVIITNLAVRSVKKMNGDVDFLVAMIKDITAEKQKEEVLKKNEALLGQMSRIAKIGGWEFNIETNELVWSDETYKIFEVNNSFVLNIENAISLYAEKSRSIISEAVERAIKFGEGYNLILEVITAKGNGIWTNSIGQANYKDGKIFSISGIIQDISEHKEAEYLKSKNVEIQQKNEEYLSLNEEYLALNEEYKMQNENLIVAKEKAEESDRLKSAFLANMSHEIRTPMNGILGFSQLLAQEDLPKEEQVELTSLINKCGVQLLTIIDDIIDISKIEANLVKISKKPININNLLSDIYKIFESRYQNAKIDLVLSKTLNDTESIIITDSSRLLQILSNLIGNALKFTPSGSVHFGYRLKGSDMEFFVKDTGIGIEEKMLVNIFERFIQVETEYSKMVGGTGLGLSISKGLVDLLGGRIWVESKFGEGSTFYFTIPYELHSIEEEQIALEISENNIVSKKRKTFLIAEDEDVNFLYITMLLKGYDIEIIHVVDGLAAIDAVLNNPNIDLVLMDMKMPKLTGYKATIEIRKHNKTIPIIAQTAYAHDADRNLALEHGCNDYISKPFTKESFFKVIEKYLKD